MTAQETILWLEMESAWDISDCQCSGCQVEEPTEIERSCEPAEYAELFFAALGVFVVASVLAWWGW